jgi:ankyrin repeat protein
MLHLLLAAGFLLQAAQIVDDPAKVSTGAENATQQQSPPAHVAFPQVRDWSSVKITLHRSGCYNVCPTYALEAHGDGEVFYEGHASVAFTGRHHGYVPQRNVSELVRLFERADFYSLQDHYIAAISDHPKFTISIEIDGVRKQVEEYAGEQAGMPFAVRELENAVDRLTGSARWTRGSSELTVPGSEDTVLALIEQHWDFKSPEAADTLARVAELGNTAVVLELLRMGTPVTGSVGYSIETPAEDRGLTALELAARRGDAEMVRALLQAGAASADPERSQGERSLDRALVLAAKASSAPAMHLLLESGAALGSRPDRGAEVLANAARSGVPEAMAELLAYRPDVNAPAADGRTALGQAMEEARKPSKTGSAEKRIDRNEVVRMLRDAGAVEAPR